jgi:hypothetical protein
MQFMNQIQKSAKATRSSFILEIALAPRKSTKKVAPTKTLRKTPTTLDWHGHLNPITEAILEIPPNPTKVKHFNRMLTYALLREAKDPKKEFEVERFVELHRRATEYWVREGGKKRENWDAVFISPEAERSNARLVRLYDRRWGIGKGERTSFGLMSLMSTTSS